MDIYCPRCAEPWDNDEFHDEAEEQGSTYRAMVKRFRTEGCAVFGGARCSENADPTTRAMIGAAMELSDHPDDWASDLDGWI